MSVKASQLLAALAVCAVLATGSVASAAAVRTWTVNSASSFVRLNIPDQSIDLNPVGLPLTGTMRLRNTDNSTWSDTGTATGMGGKRANIAGTFQTNVDVNTSQIEFLSACNTLNAVDSTNSFRPNPAVWTGFTWSDMSAAPADFAGKIRFQPQGPLIAVDFGWVAFRDVLLALSSGTITTGGAGLTGSIASSATTFSVTSTSFQLDGSTIASPINATIIDVNQSVTIPSGSNAGAGSIAAGPNSGRTLTLAINAPITIVIDNKGTTATSDDMFLSGSLTGQMVASAVVPEPSSLVLLGLGIAAVALGAIQQRRC